MATKILDDLPLSSEATTHTVNKNGGLVSVKCTLTGLSPLLINAMPRDVLLALHTKEKGAKTAERPDPKEFAASKIHRLPNGKACIPPRMLYAAMIAAGQFVRMDGKRQVSTAKGTNLPGLMTLTTFEIPLLKPGTKEEAEWTVDIQQGKNPNGGEAVCIIRPCFFAWEINVEFEVDRKVFSLDSARSLVELAGRRAGIGDFRPNHKGTFGIFAISNWKPV